MPSWSCCARARRDGFELTLLDLDEAREAQLRSGGALSEEATVPDLEELFFDLTTEGDGRVVPWIGEVES